MASKLDFRLLASIGLVLGPVSNGASAEASRTWHVAPEELKGVSQSGQFRTISEAAAKVGAGDLVLIHDGIYRESVTIEAGGTAEAPIRFEAAPGENVVISGADVIRAWNREPGGKNVFVAAWPHRFLAWSKSGTHPDDVTHRLIGRSEQVFILGYPMLQVLDRSALSRGTFYVDLDAKKLYVCPRDGADLSEEPPLVEASARPTLWEVKGAHVRLRGLRFRYAANMAQQGAAQFLGASGVIEDCVFESTNSSGATFAAEGLIVRRCTFRDNGQLGFGALRAHGLRVVDCVIRNNNVKGFARGWEAGGDKLVLCRNATIERTQVLENRGNGLWFDIGNEDCVVRNCLIADNEDAGIFYEISYGLRATDNVILGNGLAPTPGAWGAGAGISLSSSPGCVVERNLLIGNREGFDFREQGRSTPRIDDPAERPIWNHDETIRRNVFVRNRDAQVGGWFDVDDGRHWPGASQEPAEKAKGAAPAGPRGKGREDAPTRLSLEGLSLRFGENLYDARPWQRVFQWGVDWKRNRSFDGLDDVRSVLKLDLGSEAAELRFGDPIARDFRVLADSPALRLGAYPKGSVPGVVLGTLPDR